MSEKDDTRPVIHKHYHLWPSSDCGCFAVVGLAVLCYFIVMLAQVKGLPWQ